MMERLLDLQDKILRTSQALGRLESEVVSRQNSRSLQSNILSLRKLHHNLQHDFNIAAEDVRGHREEKMETLRERLAQFIAEYNSHSIIYENDKAALDYAEAIYHFAVAEYAAHLSKKFSQAKT
jgi:hypothetical protein